MPEKDPLSYAAITYAWVLTLSSWGGVVGFLNKKRSGAVRAFNITELLGEICTSAFTGIITFYLCEQASFQPLMTASFVGISGHMGSRAIFAFEKMIEKRYGL